MIDKRSDVITIRHFKRQETIFEKPGQNETGLKTLVETILANLQTRLSEGLLSTGGGGEHNKFAFERFRLATNFEALERDLHILGRECAENLSMLIWQMNSACYRAGQLDPNATIAAGILGPEFRKAQTEHAIDARRADEIQDIVDRLSYDFWDRKPEFKGNASVTATKILSTLNKEISSWEKIPHGWKAADLDLSGMSPEDAKEAMEKETKKQVERIRKRVPTPDN